MGGNLVTKMAGSGERRRRRNYGGVRGVPGAGFVGMRGRAGETENYLYQRHFVKG